MINLQCSSTQPHNEKLFILSPIQINERAERKLDPVWN